MLSGDAVGDLPSYPHDVIGAIEPGSGTPLFVGDTIRSLCNNVDAPFAKLRVFEGFEKGLDGGSLFAGHYERIPGGDISYPL